ncbi:MAG: hypothetical protein R2681_06745 [Pyrinomonadaceae bacterium]
MLTKITNFAFLLFIFSLPFVNPLYFTVSGQRVFLSELAFVAALLLLVFQFATNKQKPKFYRFYIPLIFYAGALTLSTVFSVSPRTSAIKLAGEFYLIGISVLTFLWISETKDIKKIATVWIGASMIVSFVSLITLFLFYFDRSSFLLTLTLSKYGTLPVGNYPRIQSLFLNPNMLCHYLTISWIFLFAAFKFGWLNKWLIIAAGVLFTVATAFTISPGIGGVLLAAGVWFYFENRSEEKALFSKLSLAIGLTAALLFFVSTVGYPKLADPDSGIGLQNLSLEPSVRLIAWENSVNTFLGYPVFGKGLETDVARTRYILPSGENIYLTDSHQMWLNVAGQSGITGFLALLFLCIYLIKGPQLFRFEGENQIIRTGLAIAFVSAFIYQGFFGSYENARHLWVLIGLLGWAQDYTPDPGQN